MEGCTTFVQSRGLCVKHGGGRIKKDSEVEAGTSLTGESTAPSTGEILLQLRGGVRSSL